MKKLLTIALALVMVLALAAPAMATVGFGPAAEAEAATATEWSVKIRALEFVPATNGFTFENNYYADYDPTKGIVAGSDIRFVVDVNFPKFGDIKEYDDFENQLSKMYLTVSGNNLAFGWYNTLGGYVSVDNAYSRGHEFDNGSLPRITTNSPTKAVKYMTLNDYQTGALIWNFDDNKVNTVSYIFGAQNAMYLSTSYTTTYSFMFVADVLNTADVTVTAAVTANGQTFAKNGTYRFVYDGENYSVKHTAITGGAYYDMWNETYPTEVVRFTTDSKDQITNVAVTLDYGDAYKYATVKPLNATEIANAEARVKAIMGGASAAELAAMNDEVARVAFKTWADSLVVATGDTPLYTLTSAAAEGLAQYFTPFADATVMTATSVDALKNDVETKLGYSATATRATLESKMTPVGLAYWNSVVKPAWKTAADATTTDVQAWTLYVAEQAALTPPVTLVIGLPVDQIASSITGKPYTTDYTKCVPFLGKLVAGEMSHCEWWNVNKDVRLAEVVFNLNDKVHTDGFDKTENASITDYVRGYAEAVVSAHGNHRAAYNYDGYVWCNDGTGLDIYVENQNVYDGKDVTASKDVNKVMYNALSPVFKEMMTVLGFEWDGTTAYMYRAAFVEKFGGKLSTSASYTYAAYTSALVVADPNAQPPQTGDTTSILGFVMIAVAVLAAGAVVVKKVRA